jgi:acetolactate decarboxylase
VDITGTVHELDPDTRTPFAVVGSMNDPRSRPLDAGTRYDDLKKIVDHRISSPNYIFTIRVDGTFDAITVRSVPRQEPPYRRLTEVIKNQRTFEYSNVEGTLVGFRFPGYMKRLNAEGYHLHFLSDDRTKGGHVLEFTTGDVELSIERERSLKLILPGHDQFSETDLSEHRSREVREVEKQ